MSEKPARPACPYCGATNFITNDVLIGQTQARIIQCRDCNAPLGSLPRQDTAALIYELQQEIATIKAAVDKMSS